MPIYEYECTKCGHLFEALQKASEAPLKKCPECHHSTLQKLVSATSFQLKGTGWYVTDFKDKKKPQEKSKESGSTGSSSGGDKKTETKSTESKKDKA
jgi:putative FmdB family regulatory protein